MNTFTIRELAKLLDIGHADALDVAREHGVTIFRHEGRRLTMNELASYLKRDWMYDPTPDLEFDNTPSLDDYLFAKEHSDAGY